MLAPKKRLRARFPCIPSAPTLIMAWLRLIPLSVLSASKSGSIRAISCPPNVASLAKLQRLFLSLLPHRAKSAVSAVVMAASVGSVVRVRKETDHVVENAEIVASVVMVALAVIVVRVRKETDHRASVVLAHPVHRASVVSARREIVVLALLVHRANVASAHSVRKVSVPPVKAEIASHANLVQSSRLLPLPIR